MSGCSHKAATHVLTLNGCQVWAGGKDDALAHANWSLMFCLAGTSTTYLPSNPTKPSDAAKSIVPNELWEFDPPPVFAIEWPDGKAPTLTRDWWERLVEFLLSGEMDGEKVIFYCHGGHGRTGTALSIILALSGELPKGKDPVAKIRKLYCDDAVESWSQVDYIEAVTGRKVKVTPSNMNRAGSSTWFSGPPATSHGGTVHSLPSSSHKVPHKATEEPKIFGLFPDDGENWNEPKKEKPETPPKT